jgi:hypothetical protein
MCPWINLPPLAIFAHPPVGCGHCRLLQSIKRLNTPQAAGTSPRATVRVAPGPTERCMQNLAFWAKTQLCRASSVGGLVKLEVQRSVIGLPVPSGLCHHHHRHAISIPPRSPHRRQWVGDGSRADDGAGGGSQGRAGAAITQLKMKGSPAMTINLRR